jgi:ATP-dependent exoDNAse (exonuclease V) alpha subunit
MKEVKTGVESNGKKLFAFAPSADASRGVLRSKNFEGADTIKKLLDSQKLQEQLKDQVVLIDEAGMVGTQTMNGIFEIAKKQNARVILSGDWKQHNSVEAGDALRLLEQHTELPISRVSEIVRQKDKSAYKQAVQALSEGNYDRGFAQLERMNSIIGIEDQVERHDRIAKDYLQSIQAPLVRERGGKTTPRTAIVVSPTHAEGRAITAAIRGKLKEEGLLGQEERTFNVLRNLSYTEAEKQDHLNYQSGMTVQFHKSHKAFKAGSSYDVVSVGKDGKIMLQGTGQEQLAPLPFDQSKKYQVYRKEQISVAQGDILRVTGNGKSADSKTLNNGENYTIKGFTEDGHIELNDGKILQRDYRNFNLGYYRTSHASQGKDAHDVLIAQSATSFPASNEKQFYVSVSRGVERCFIYTDDKEALKWSASQEADRMSAAEVAEATKDHSMWLAARHAFRQQQIQHYQKDMEQYQRTKPLKEQTYERDITIVPSRGGEDLYIDF